MQNPYFLLLRTAWKYARKEKFQFVLIYSMFAISNIIIAMNPLFYGWFVDNLQRDANAVLRTAWIYAAGFLGLRLAEWMFHGPARVMERKLAFHISRNFLDELYQKILKLPSKWHQENHSGSTISKVRKSHEALRDFFQHGFIYFYSFGKFLFSFAAMLYFSPLFGAIGVLLGMTAVYIIIQFDKPYVKTLRQVNEREHEVSSTLFDSLSNIGTVISLRLEKSIHLGLMQKLAEVFPPFKRNVKINEWKWFVAQMMVGLIYAVITVGYIFQNYKPGEAFLISGLVVLLGYVTQFTSVFNDIASQYTQIMRYSADLQNAKVLEQAFEEMPEKKVIPPLPMDWRQIEVEDLNFLRDEGAASGKQGGLYRLSLRIARGERIALIGESGSGKSTLLSLLRGLHDPQPVPQVRVDGESMQFASIGCAITLFPQEPEIFENTVRYNITMGLPFSDAEVRDACAAAQFTDVLERLPKGMDTLMHEKGVNLSGGQKQRLALARGILAARHSSIVLMDEPTSSVDSRTEKIVYEKLFTAFQGKAIISSLHRLHLLKDFDYIYLMREGAIIDEGTLDDLLRSSLVFKELWRHQAALDEPANETTYPELNIAL